MLDVVNLAHGSFYMLGAYAGLSLIAATGNFWLALLLAPLAVGARRAGRAHVPAAALPAAPAGPGALDLRPHLPVRGLVKWIWGGRIRSIPTPDLLLGFRQRLGEPPSRPTDSSSSGSASAMAVVLWLLDRADAARRRRPGRRVRRRDDGGDGHQYPAACSPSCERPLDGVGSRHGRPAAHDLETRPAVRPHVDNPRAQIQLHRHGERIETAAEVRDRAGNEDVSIHSKVKRPAETGRRAW